MARGGIHFVVVALVFIAIYLAEASPAAVVTAHDDNAVAVQRTSKLTRGSSRSVMLDIARELIARTTGNSQVLSLSVTNLIILLVLKVLLLGAGLFSYGIWRRSEDANIVRSFRSETGRGMHEGEILLVLSYLMGDTAGNEGGYDCMYRVACEEPSKAKEYLSASRMLLKGAKLFNKLIPYNPKYEDLVYGLHEAIEFGQDGQECPAKYRCSRE